MKSILQMLVSMIAALATLGEQFRVGAPRRPRLRVANTYDAAVATHDRAVNRTNDAAVTTRHLLWKKGVGNGTVALNGVSDIPLGTIDNVEAGTGANQSILLLGRGPTKKMVASKAIAAGVPVFAAANGKISDSGTIQIGVSLTAAGQDGDILEVNDCVPVDVSGS